VETFERAQDKFRPLYLAWLNEVRQGLFPKGKASGWYKNYEFEIDSFAALSVCLAQVSVFAFLQSIPNSMQADKVIMTKFTYDELASRRILSPGLEYASGKSEAVEGMRLSASLHQDRWPEVGTTTFLFYQAELHRKALTRTSVESSAEHQSPSHSTGLALYLGDLEQHFSAPGLATVNTGTAGEEEEESSEGTGDSGEGEENGDGD
jgi:hypothetical protein